MSVVHLDFESRSTVDLRKCGLYVYAENPDTDVWCAAFCVDDGEIKTWRPGAPCPPDIVEHAKNGGEFFAHNSSFERMLWNSILVPRYGWPTLAIDRWHCTMARAHAMALPGALDSAAAALGISEAKDPVGYRIMLRMSRPRHWDGDKPVWWEDEARIKQLLAYCVQDVVVERMLHQRLMDLRPLEKKIWLLDAIINDRGIGVDRALCNAAKPIIRDTLVKLNHEIRVISQGFIPSCDNVAKITEFCRLNGVDTDSMRKGEVTELLAVPDLPPVVRRVLEIRSEAGKAAVKKIDALLNGTSRDGRARGLLAYHGAATGRWSARRFQPQNIKRPKDKDQDNLIPLVMTGSAKAVEMLGGPPLEVVGDVLRGMLVASPGSSLYAADYSNIEGRALAWLAGERWKLQAFIDFDNGIGPDLYKLAYARSFGIKPENVTSHQRQIGKVMELALGYQGGVGAFQSMAANYGIEVDDDRANELKKAWREAHPNIVQFWYDTEAAALRAVTKPGQTVKSGKIAFKCAGSFLFMRLPSGRALTYPYPKLREVVTPWGSTKLGLTYKTTVNPSNARRIIKDPNNAANWARVSTYGGSLVENATQAVARDVMAEAMLRVEGAGYPVVLTVHDEIVSEAKNREVDEFQSLMETPPPWAVGFPIAAQAWSGPRYRKD